MSSEDHRPLPSIQRGSGSPVVLLHGFGLSPNTYRQAIDRLAAHVRVVAPMWLYVEGDWSESSVTGGLAATLDALGEEQVTLVGHSFGGALALLLAAERPSRISRLVLVNAMGASTSETMRTKALSPRAGRLASLRAAGDLLGSLTTEGRDLARAGLWAYRRGGFEREIESIAAHGLDAVVLWTADDTLLPTADGAALAERLSARFLLVEDRDRRLDHDWPYRDPDRFADALLEVVALAA